MTSTVQLAWSLVASAIGMVIACSLALWLIPRLSLNATIRGGNDRLFRYGRCADRDVVAGTPEPAAGVNRKGRTSVSLY